MSNLKNRTMQKKGAAVQIPAIKVDQTFVHVAREWHSYVRGSPVSGFCLHKANALQTFAEDSENRDVTCLLSSFLDLLLFE